MGQAESEATQTRERGPPSMLVEIYYHMSLCFKDLYFLKNVEPPPYPCTGFHIGPAESGPIKFPGFLLYPVVAVKTKI